MFHSQMVEAFINFHKISREARSVFNADAGLSQSLGTIAEIIEKVFSVERIMVTTFSADNRHEQLEICIGSTIPYANIQKRLLIKTALKICEAVTEPISSVELIDMLEIRDEKELVRSMRPFLFVPIGVREHVVGALWFISRGEADWETETRDFLAGVADTLAIVIKNDTYHKRHTGKTETLTSVLDNLDACISVSDIKTCEIMFANKKMREEFSLPDDYTGSVCWKVFQTGKNERCQNCPVDKLLASDEQYHRYEEYNTVTGKNYANTDSIIIWIDGKKAHLRHSVDITSQKRASEAIEEARASAEKATRAKSEFLSRMSHEIRTPLNAVIGMSSIAMRTENFDKQKYYISKIDESGKQLLSIVNDILDISKIEANKMTVDSMPFDLEKLMMSSCSAISAKAEDKHQKLHVEMDMRAPKWVAGDEMKLTQVLTNLLSNAVKFTPDNGSITLESKMLSKKGKVCKFQFTVRDTGIGIDPAILPNLFNSFEQADGSFSRKFGGTGLGLSISKKIVDLMGGQISVKSEVGKGSEFYVVIDLAESADDRSIPESLKGTEISQLSVLIIDDDPELCAYFKETMKYIGCRAECAESYSVAKQIIQNNGPFDIIFIDWMLPGIDGVEAARLIKQSCQSAIIIMISSADRNDIEADLKKSGIVKFLPKPLFPSTIVDTLNEIVGVSKASLRDKAKQRKTFKSSRILVAEDIEINREILARALDETEIEIIFAENGAAAVERFGKCPKQFDLILMDVQMPVMDGFSATANIRSMDLPEAKLIPIIAMTANVFTEDINACMEAGMTDHIAKPLDMDKLFGALEKYLYKYLKVEQEEVQKLPPVDEEMEKAVKEDTSAPETLTDSEVIQFIDIGSALERVKGNKKILKTLLSTFIKKTRFDELKAEIEAGNLRAAASTAHTIKGIAANLSLTAVNDMAIILETQLKHNYNTEATMAKFETVINETLKCVDYLMNTL